MNLRQPLSRLVADQIRDHISNGVLLPGQKLNEREIMDQFQITRTPLREAISILVGEKLVELSPNRGALVTTLSDEDVKGLLDVRASLERLAGELATGLLTDNDIRKLDGLCERMDAEKNEGSSMEWWSLNRQFHRSIIALSGNPFLMDYYANISVRMTVYNFFNRVAVTTTDRWTQSSEEHAEIMTHLKARDGRAVGVVLEEHLKSSWLVARQVVQARGGDTKFFASRFRELKTAEAAEEN